MIIIDALIRSNRKTVSLIISPQGKLIVRAPKTCPISYINMIIEKRENWITQHQQKIKHRADLNSDILNYRTVLFLGNVYRLALADNIKDITLYNDALYIPYKTPKEKIKKNLVKWFKKQALKIGHERITYYANIMQKFPANFSTNNTKTSWGLCNNKHEIKLNWRTVMLPPKLLDYVVVHELAHLEEFNHSKRFWQIVSNVLPDTKERRAELKKGDYLLSLFREVI